MHDAIEFGPETVKPPRIPVAAAREIERVAANRRTSELEPTQRRVINDARKIVAESRARDEARAARKRQRAARKRR